MSVRKNRRLRAVGLAAAAAVALGAVGCGSQPGTGSKGTAAEQSGAAPAARDGGTLRVVTNVEPASLNPIVTAPRLAQNIAVAVVERLVAKSADNQPEFDGLATKVDNVDKDTFRVRFRRGVRFSDGEALDAAAVKFSMDTQKRSATGVNLGTTVAGVRVTGPTTVEFDVKRAITLDAMIAQLTEVFVVPPTYYAKVGEDGFGRAPVGTGPFQFVRWQSGRQITLKRNPRYWNGGAKLDGVEVSFNKSDSGRIALVKAKQADITGTVSPTVLKTADGTGTKTVSREGALMSFLGFADKAPVNDAKLRRAVALSLDRDAIANKILSGQATPRRTLFFPQFDDATNTDVAPAYDAAKAEAAGARLNIGQPITLSYPSGAYPLDAQIGEAVAGALKQAGISVKQDPSEQATLSGRWLNGELNGMFLQYYELRYPNLAYYKTTFFSSTGIFHDCNSPELDRLGNRAAAEADPTKAQVSYDEIQKIAVGQKLCMIPLYQLKDNYTMSDRVQGFTARFDQTYDWKNLALSE